MSQDSPEKEGVRIIGSKVSEDTKTNNDVSTTVKPMKDTDNIELPHWSEAPTGEVKAVGNAHESGESSSKPKDGWESLTGSQPRIRVDSTDWQGVDYDPDLSLNDDSLNVGALGNDHISFNETEDEFKETVAKKRRQPIGSKTDDEVKPVVKKISTIPDVAVLPEIDAMEETSPEVLSSNTAKVKPENKRSRPTRKSRSDYSGDVVDKQNQDDGEVAPTNEISVLIQRTLSALALAAVAGICMFFGALPTLVFVALLIGYMSVELSNAFKTLGAKPAVILVALVSVFSVFAGYLIGDSAVAVSITVFIVFAGIWYLIGVQKARPVIGMAISSLVFVYVGILGSFAGMILALKDSANESIGVSLLLSIVLCVAANDTVAYLAGKYFGTTPIAPSISPNKTMEGTTAGVIASLLMSVFIASSLNNVFNGVPSAVLLGLACAACAFGGDLVESMLKRDCKVKDFGTIMPGHGGLMDRFDGLLFALPVIYFLAIAMI